MSRFLGASDRRLAAASETWANELIHRSGDERLKKVAYVPQDNPLQRGFYVESEPRSVAEINILAGLADPNYNAKQQHLASHPESLERMVMIARELNGTKRNHKDAKSIVAAFPHPEIITMPTGAAAMYGPLSDMAPNMRTAVMLGNAIPHVGVDFNGEVLQSVKALEYLCRGIYKVFPRTKSASIHGFGRYDGPHGLRERFNLPQVFKDKIDNYNINKNNKSVREHVTKNLGRGGLFLAVNPSGTVDKPNPEIPGTINLEGMSRGMIEIMQTPNTLVVAVASKKGVLEVCSDPTVIENEEQAHGVMYTIADALNRIDPETNHVYRA